MEDRLVRLIELYKKVDTTFSCEWCKQDFESDDLRKIWVCEDCMVPRRQAATILRGLPFNSHIRRAAYIVESPKVEEYLIVEHAMADIHKNCLTRRTGAAPKPGFEFRFLSWIKNTIHLLDSFEAAT